MLLFIDNFDSFSYNLIDYFARAGVSCRVFRNTALLSEITAHDYQGVVLSPGPGTPDASGNLREVIEYYTDRLPMLGICLGHQALGEYFGAKLKKALRPMHGKISEVHVFEDDLFLGLPELFSVVRYHSLVLSDMPPCLRVTSETAEGEIMSFSHKERPLRGIQFHPEAWLTEFGLSVLRNWLTSAGILHGILMIFN